jgi:hypothetical protein
LILRDEGYTRKIEWTFYHDSIAITEKSETFIIRINKLASVKNKKNINEKGTIF